jgi:hypothetical protein
MPTANSHLQPRLGVADDPGRHQPSLADSLASVVSQADDLAADVLHGLMLGASSAGPQSIPAFRAANVKQALALLDAHAADVRRTFATELSRLVYQGGGREQSRTEVLRYEDLELFGDDELDQSIEVARALQEVSIAVDDVLPTLDALVSTLLGWRSVQPGLNPIRPEVFVRALQHTLAVHVPDAAAREAIVTPAGGLLGVGLRRMYRQVTDWLLSHGVEPVGTAAGKSGSSGGRSGGPGTMARTLLTLDRLRKLLAGDFDPQPAHPEFTHTVPASLALLQELKQVDALVKRLEGRPNQQPAAGVDEEQEAPRAPVRLGRQLGDEVLRLMFDTLLQDDRLLPAFQEQLRALQPAVNRLAQQDSRFFSDRSHPARMLLDRLTQRSLGFKSESDEGFDRFMVAVKDAVRWVAGDGDGAGDADTFGRLLTHLDEIWAAQDEALRRRREEAARALLHAEQRNLLATKLAAEFDQAASEAEVPAFVAEFLRSAWAQVVAEAQLSCTDGSDDPFGYRALVDDLIWSVQTSTARRGRARRLAQLVPELLAKLREGLKHVQYPPELTQRFFDSLLVLHESALQDGRDIAMRRAAEALDREKPAPQPLDEREPWIADSEAHESGWIDDSGLPQGAELSAFGPQDEAGEPATGDAAAATGEIRRGSWAELKVAGEWIRVQLTWASPHGTMLNFTSQAGTSHSMSRRTMERLRTGGLLRVVAQRNVVDEALDQVAQAALKNSVDDRGG